MRDIFELFGQQPIDPTESARRGMRPKLRERFYRQASRSEGPPFAILLDGRPAKTPAGGALTLPSPPLADAVAAEWERQDQHIDHATMPLTRFANAVIDGVAAAPAPVTEEVARYLGSDLVCYRADGPEGLVRAQVRNWDPILMWARESLGARFVLTEGVMFVAQPEQAIQAARGAIPSDPWRLAAVNVITTLTGSALIALAVAQGLLGVDEAWAAAHVDEDWNMAQWGSDEVALERRATRFAEMQAAATVLALTH